MEYNKAECNILYETFDFYNRIVYKSEEKHFVLIENLHIYLDQHKSPTMAMKNEFKTNINNSFSNLLAIYSKQNDAISGLIECNKVNKSFLSKKEITRESLLSLKNLTASLIEQLILHRNQINSLLS